MSDIFGEIRAILANPPHDCVLPFYGAFNFITESALARVILDYPKHKQEALHYLLSLNSPDINLGILFTYLDLDPQNSVLEPHHFHWTETSGERSRYASRVRASNTFLQSKFACEHLEYWPSGTCFIKDCFHTRPDPFSSISHDENTDDADTASEGTERDFTTALRQAYAHKTFYEPGNRLYQYQEWIRKGQKPSQFGLIPPQEIASLKLQITQEQLDGIHGGREGCRQWERWTNDYSQKYMPRIDDDFSRCGHKCSLGTQEPAAFIYMNTLMEIRVPLAEAQTVSALTKYVKKCLLDAWEYMETKDLPFMAVMPPELFFNPTDLYALAHAEEIALENARWARLGNIADNAVVADNVGVVRGRVQQQLDDLRAFRDNDGD